MRGKNIFLLFFLLIFSKPIQVFCQNTTTVEEKNVQLKGVVFELENNLPLVYVNIGILNKSVGTVSDSLGNYSLFFKKDNLTDTLQLSMVGYVTKKVLLNELFKAGNKNIKLSKQVFQLQEVFVTNKKTNTEIVGRTSASKLVQASLFYGDTKLEQSIGSEIGMKLKTKKKDTIIRDVNVNLSQNNLKNLKFRVNVYAVKNNLPDTIICKKEIFASIEHGKTGWSKIDLEAYQISVTSEFVITLQLLEAELENVSEKPVALMPVGFSPFSKNFYMRIASQDKWQRKPINLSFYVTLLH